MKEIVECMKELLMKATREKTKENKGLKVNFIFFETCDYLYQKCDQKRQI